MVLKFSYVFFIYFTFITWFLFCMNTISQYSTILVKQKQDYLNFIDINNRPLSRPSIHEFLCVLECMSNAVIAFVWQPIANSRFKCVLFICGGNPLRHWSLACSEIKGWEKRRHAFWYKSGTISFLLSLYVLCLEVIRHLMQVKYLWAVIRCARVKV